MASCRRVVTGHRADGTSIIASDEEVPEVEIPGQPGSYNAIAWLCPWLQLEELTASLRMVARIPQLGE